MTDREPAADRPVREPTRDGPRDPADASAVLRFSDYRWSGVEPRPYRDREGAWRGVVRHPLIGEPDDDHPFHTRYFEVEPGGHTMYERHRHRHVVMVIRGRGEVRLGERTEPVGFGDLVYVAPDEPHQFRAAADAPLGFLCIVPARRDRPRPVSR